MKLRKIEDDELDDLIDNGDLATKKAIIKALREDDSAQIATGDGIVVVSGKIPSSKARTICLWLAYLTVQIICVSAQVLEVVAKATYIYASKARVALERYRDNS